MRLRVIDVVSGTERMLPTELARPLNIENLINMKYSLQHAYIKSHFNRLMYNNRYIGPNENKSWRNMIQSAASGEDAPLYSESGHNSSEDQIQDPDTLKKTRSGKVYFSHTTPMKSIWKSTPPFHHDQEIIMCQSPSDLAAYKKCLRHALDPITENQKKILTMDPGTLQYSSMKEWSLPSPRTGKSISINPTAQVKTGNEITLQPLDQ